MAAYGLCADRIQNPPKYYALTDPGSYQYEKPGPKPNKVPFLSNAPRKMDALGGTSWTDAVYNTALPHSIPNVTALISKTPRFPYEAFSEEDLKELLCKCGIDNPCECPDIEKKPSKIICQGKVRRCLFKGRAPRVIIGEEKIIHEKIVPDPPFYDAKVWESTEFYHGCKWSQRTSKRCQESKSERRPGPADYTLVKEPTEDQICAEKVREYKRKTCRQLRFIEMIQQQNILDGRPGPASYDTAVSTDNNIQFLGPKADRFPVSKITTAPGPADHWIRRDFDLVEPPDHLCRATLPALAPFGIKAPRFKPRREEGPGPASYNSAYKPCQILHCTDAPFNCSAARFKTGALEETHYEDNANESEPEPSKVCQKPTWQFMPKSIKTSPLDDDTHQEIPVSLPPTRRGKRKPPNLQYIAPFWSSDGRFQPWHNWIGVYGQQKTPGPCYYELALPKCYPAVRQGPLFRAKRFPTPNTFITPASNAYDIGGGVISILETKNKRLADNVQKRPKFHWEPPFEQKYLSPEERQNMLIKKCIALLDTSTFPPNMLSTPPSITPKHLFKDKIKHGPVIKPLESVSQIIL